MIYVIFERSCGYPTSACPKPDQFNRCSCVDYYYVIKLNCTSISMASQFRREVADITWPASVDIYISQSRIAKLTKDLFAGMLMQSFNTETVLLTNIEPGTFDYSRNTLKTISIIGHLINSIPVGALRCLDVLETLNLSSGGSFDIIYAYTFRNMLHSLEKLAMALCDIKIIQANAFHSLHNLKSLDLSNNPLKTISANILPYAYKLQNINLE